MYKEASDEHTSSETHSDYHFVAAAAAVAAAAVAAAAVASRSLAIETLC